MKDHDEITDRLRGLLAHHLQVRLDASTLRLPHRCVHNHRQPIDSEKQRVGEPNPGYNRLDRRFLPVVNDIGLCMVGAEDPETWPGAICQDPIDAQRCPLFTPYETVEDVVRQFEANVRDGAWLEANLPDVAALVWALDVDPPAYRLPWWRRIWLKLFPPPVERQLPAFDPATLLPGPDDARPRS